MPKISIIVPVYNSESYLKRCLDSILEQSFEDWEAILVDDGSIDKSGAICDEYARRDSRFSVIHRMNGGASSARNNGIGRACGTWITFCDSDDYVLPNFFESALSNVKDADVYISGLLIKSADSSMRELPYIASDNSKISHMFPKIWENEMYGSLCGKLFKHEIIQRNGLLLDETIRLREDEEFFMRYLCASDRVTLVDECYYVYDFQGWSKYDGIDNFSANLSILRSTLKLGAFPVIVEKFLSQTVSSLFYAYDSRNPKHKEYLHEFRTSIGGLVKDCDDLSVFSRMLLSSGLPDCLLDRLFVVKSNL